MPKVMTIDGIVGASLAGPRGSHCKKWCRKVRGGKKQCRSSKPQRSKFKWTCGGYTGTRSGASRSRTTGRRRRGSMNVVPRSYTTGEGHRPRHYTTGQGHARPSRALGPMPGWMRGRRVVRGPGGRFKRVLAGLGRCRGLRGAALAACKRRSR